MSRPELLASLRQATPAAPPALRSRVRLAASGADVASAPRRLRRPGWRLSLVAVAALLVAAGAAVVLRPGGGRAPLAAPPQAATLKPSLAAGSAAHAPAAAHFAPGLQRSAVVLPAPSGSRAQRYGATLTLRLASGSAVAAAARRAVRVAEALGGYAQAVEVSVSAPTGSATIVLRVPRGRVSQAIGELATLGTVIGEHVAITDLQAGIDSTGLRIRELERSLDAAIHAPQSPREQRLVAALTAEIVGLQRQRAASERAAADATVTLHLHTPLRTIPKPRPRRRHAARGPFHDLGVAFRDLGVGAVYALALGGPFALVLAVAWLLTRRLRRRREERLLSRS